MGGCGDVGGRGMGESKGEGKRGRGEGGKGKDGGGEKRGVYIYRTSPPSLTISQLARERVMRRGQRANTARNISPILPPEFRYVTTAVVSLP